MRKGSKQSPESIEKIRAVTSGSNNGMWGRKHSPESIEKMCAIKLGSKNPSWRGGKSGDTEQRAKITAMTRGLREARRLYITPEGYERHHIDGNTQNNVPSNVLFLIRREHMIKDGRMEKLIKRNKSSESREKNRSTVCLQGKDERGRFKRILIFPPPVR